VTRYVRLDRILCHAPPNATPHPNFDRTTALHITLYLSRSQFAPTHRCPRLVFSTYPRFSQRLVIAPPAHMSAGYLPQPTTTPPSLYLPTSASANENRPQKRQRTQHAAPGGAVQDSSRVLTYVNTQGGTLNGNGSGNAGYGNANGQKASNGGNSAAVQKQSYLSPPVVHANVANVRGNLPGRRNITTPAPSVSGGDTGGPGSSGGVEDVAFSSLRVREEGSTEIFAVPLGIVNGWEVRDLFVSLACFADVWRVDVNTRPADHFWEDWGSKGHELPRRHHRARHASAFPQRWHAPPRLLPSK
jgi:hypothetical protein